VRIDHTGLRHQQSLCAGAPDPGRCAMPRAWLPRCRQRDRCSSATGAGSAGRLLQRHQPRAADRGAARASAAA
jgi:hypothetical protein